MYMTYRKDPSKDNQHKFKQYANRLKKIVKLTKKAQNDNFIKSSGNKSKATWKVISSSKSKIPKETIQHIKTDDKKISNPQEIAEAFNDHYVDTIQKHDNTKHNEIFNEHKHYSSMFMRPTDPCDVLEIISKLKNTNSTGNDEISTKIIKYVKDLISPVLSHIINMCIEKGKFPDTLKLTVIKPMFKKVDKENMEYYRPVALIPVFSKIFERYIYNSLYEYLQANNILVEEQKGFRKGRTIDMAVFEFISRVITCMDKGQPVSALFMDMKKAFDFVDHNILLNKLERYGVRGTVLNLIRSYLNNRSQVTQIGRICPKCSTETVYTSGPRQTKFGVPQGSVLGPLLFLVYINDLPKVVNHPMVLFADDSTALFMEKDKNYTSSRNKCIIGNNN